jgi:hypothetical protein
VNFKSILASALIVVGMSVVKPAGAATYTYIGGPMQLSGHVEASINLNCTGPCTAGDYLDGANLTSFTLTYVSSLNVPLFSVGSGSPFYHSGGYQNYVTLNSTGSVVSWFLFANTVDVDTLIAISIATLVNNTPAISGCHSMCEDQESALKDGSFGIADFHFIFNSASTWELAVAEVPLPGSFALFVGGLVLLGFLGIHKRRNSSSAATA